MYVHSGDFRTKKKEKETHLFWGNHVIFHFLMKSIYQLKKKKGDQFNIIFMTQLWL